MRNDYSNKAEVCYKDVCATFYDNRANIVLAVVVAAIAIIAVSVASKAIS